jgi:hypothetical protein
MVYCLPLLLHILYCPYECAVRASGKEEIQRFIAVYRARICKHLRIQESIPGLLKRLKFGLCIVHWGLIMDHREPQFSRVCPIKGIDRSFELRGEIRLICFVITNWRLGIFLKFILKGHHHKIIKKPQDAA